MYQDNSFRKLDVYSIGYTENPSNYKFMVGRSLTDNKERYITEVKINPEEQGYKDFISFCINEAKSVTSRTIAIDYRLLNEEIVEVLKNAYIIGNITGIRLLPDSSTLTKDIIELFQDKAFKDFLIVADNIEENNNTHLDIREENNLCKIEHIVYSKNTDGIEHDEFNVHITRKLSIEEIKELGNLLKQHNYNKLVIDFYEPMYYKKLLNELKNVNISKNIQIMFLANPLYDESEIFEGLSKIIDNEIIVQYNTCNDLNEYHRGEPFTTGATYYSDIEASGKTTPENYASMIKMFDEINRELTERNYSPLEKVVYIHEYFKKNFQYNQNYSFEENGANSDLDKVYDKDRMICEGFSNLYSALLRREGIMCFTYGTDIHQKNIIRITDEKYGIDNIALIDPTWDLDNFNNRNIFSHFLVPIDNDLYAADAEVINIPTALTINNGTYSNNIKESNPVYATDPLGYGIRMLELMGLGNKHEKIETEEDKVKFYKSALANSDLIKRIPTDPIAKAVHTVRKDNREYTQDFDEEYDYEEIIRNVEERGNPKVISPRIRLFDGTEVSTRNYIPKEGVHFTEIDNQAVKYHRPRKRMETETEEQYNTYLEKFYNDTFYENNKSRNQEKQTTKEKDIEQEQANENKKENIEEYFMVEKIRIFRDINNKSRLFAKKSVFERFHVELPEKYISIPKRENIYELNNMFAYLILNNNENTYAPYDIEFEDINISELEELNNNKVEDDLIPGTNFKKPRGRGIYETDDEYVAYLEYYYNTIFPPEENKKGTREDKKINEDNISIPRPRGTYETDEEYTRYLQNFYGTVPQEELIPGTNYRKPRGRGNYETDEEYEEFLEKYYTEIFGEEVVKQSKSKGKSK